NGMAVQSVADFLFGNCTLARTANAQRINQCKQLVQFWITTCSTRHASVERKDSGTLDLSFRVGPNWWDLFRRSKFSGHHRGRPSGRHPASHFSRPYWKCVWHAMHQKIAEWLAPYASGL